MQEPSGDKDTFTCVYQPSDYQQLMMIKMLLERENVNYYIQGEVDHIVAVPRVMVEIDRAEEIKNAVRDELGLK